MRVFNFFYMKYFVGVSSKDPKNLKISFREYESLKQAQLILHNAGEIEEKYDFMIINYLQLENFLFNTTNEFIIRHGHDYSDFFELRHNLDVCLVNILSSIRLYRDQLIRNVKGCIPNTAGINTLIKSLLSTEYDSNRDYRFMEAFRNYVQHCGLPVKITSLDLRRKRRNMENIFVYTIDFFSQTSHLRKDNIFKKAVLAELGEEVNLKTSIRGYIESMSKIHESVRDLIRNHVTNARSLIENTHKRMKSSNRYHHISLRAFADDGKGNVISIPLLLEWDDCRVELEEKNKTIKNLKQKFISTLK